MQRNLLFIAVFTLSGCASIALSPAPEIASQPYGLTRLPPPPNPELLFQALAALNTPYRRGGDSFARGFDCSGLVAYVYRRAFGIELPHSVKAQSEAGVPVPRSELEPGDLVFFDTEGPLSHVGIFLGDERFIHSPRPGARVRVENMRSSYWTTRFEGARRIAISLGQATASPQ